MSDQFDDTSQDTSQYPASGSPPPGGSGGQYQFWNQNVYDAAIDAAEGAGFTVTDDNPPFPPFTDQDTNVEIPGSFNAYPPGQQQEQPQE